MNPVISVVIPSYNGRTYLEGCLSGLGQVDGTEIVVVDNGSSDGTADMIREHFPWVRVIRNETNLGFALANNLAARLTRGEWVLFLNNDTVPQPGFLEALKDELQRHPETAVWTSKIRLLSDPKRLDAVDSMLTPTGFFTHIGLYEVDEGQYDGLKELHFPKGVAFMVRKSLFFDLGGFDETFFCYFEETDFFWRVHLKGHRIGFAPRSIVHHKIGGTSSRSTYAWVDFHNFKNRIRTLLKNLEGRTLIWMLPLHLACCFGLIGFHTIFGRFGNAWAILRAMGWNIKVLPQTLRTRRTIQRGRSVSDRALFEKILRPIPFKTFAQYAWCTVVVRKKAREKVWAGAIDFFKGG